MKHLYLLILATLSSFISFASVGPLTGPDTLCASNWQFYHDPTTGGTWSSSAPAIATVDSVNGMVTGISAGTATITHTVGTAYATKTITVVMPPYWPSAYLTVSHGPSSGSYVTDTFHAVVTGGGPLPVYGWIKNATLIPGATTSTYVALYLYPGDSICCHVGDGTGGCGRAEACKIVTVNTGITSMTPLPDVTLSPSPTQGRLTVKANAPMNEGVVQVRVTDLVGQTIYNAALPVKNGLIAGEITMDERIANGVYILSLQTSTHCVMRQFVLQRQE